MFINNSLNQFRCDLKAGLRGIRMVQLVKGEQVKERHHTIRAAGSDFKIQLFYFVVLFQPCVSAATVDCHLWVGV